ncbi:MAG: anthranilate phosphoribosyltransferase family protein [Synechococcales bacterium]|nr:anthranilate phosphoribosyltransferase family protein [Synechococcales bacterium]
MSDRFRDLLRKVGSGPHTGKDLTRAEAALATRLMLYQEATPAQIGAFMIAHRIKRPTGEELAGMLDAYDQLGPHLTPIAAAHPAVVLNSPYDGRSRTAPIHPLTTLILLAAGCPVVLHGGARMPTKYGVPHAEIWQGLGVDWTRLSLASVQQVFAETGLGLLYTPNQFAIADQLVPYRDQIGKRPPLATIELLWCPYQGEALLACGYVHPPTEQMARDAFALRSTEQFVTVKGLEGSCDLPRDRTCILGLSRPSADACPTFERLLLHPRDFGFGGADVPFEDTPSLIESTLAVLQGDTISDLARSAIWNGGFYLWCNGVSADLPMALEQAAAILADGQAWQSLLTVRTAVAARDAGAVPASAH